MSLSEFKRIDIRLDKANDYIPQRIYAKEGDANGRDLYVQLTNNGEVVDTSGTTLNLGWTHLSTGGTGLDSFTNEDLSQGIYKHSFTTAFLQPGRVECSVQIVSGTDVVNSRTFFVEVDGSTYDETAVASDNSFTALQDALLTVSSYDGRILNLENTKAEQSYVEGEVDRIDAQLAHTITEVSTTNKRIDNLIIEPGNTDAEVADARISLSKNKSYDVLSDRLNALESNTDFILNNLIKNGNFETTEGWTDDLPSSVNLHSMNNTLIATGSGGNSAPQFKQVTPSTTGKVLLNFRFKVNNSIMPNIRVFVGSQAVEYTRTLTGDTRPRSFSPNEWCHFSEVYDVSNAERVKVIMTYNSAELALNQSVTFAPMALTNLSNVFQGDMIETAEKLARSVGYYNGEYSLTKHVMTSFYTDVDTNVKTFEQYGAVGDGVTDDTLAVQSALLTGGDVFVGEGTYKITGTIAIPSNTRIRGLGDKSKITIGVDYDLIPTTWREGMPDYYPYLIAQNESNIEIENLVIQGNLDEASYEEKIHVGLAFDGCSNVKVNNVDCLNINYFPSQAPPRPSGQWRTGWSFLAIRSNDVVVDGGRFEYGGYECLRIGDDCNNVTVKNARIAYGWRTCIQALRGCQNVIIENCDIEQDDFGTNDSHAAMTFHSAENAEIKNIKVINNRIKGKMFLGGAGISFVDYFMENFTISDNEIISNGSGISLRGGGHNVFNNKIIANSLGISYYPNGTNSSSIDSNKVESNDNHAIYIETNGVIVVGGSISRNELSANSTKEGIRITTTSILNGLTSKENVGLSGLYTTYSTGDVSNSVFKDNIGLGTNNSVSVLGESNIITDNI